MLNKRFNKSIAFFMMMLFVFVLLSQGQVREVKIMAANTTSGKYQKYEGPGIRMFQALKPDICCIQEFNYDGSIDDFVKKAFGEDYNYYREPYNSGGDIANGVIFHKDFKLLDKGSWKDSQISNRGYAYVRLDVPGDNNPHLFVISVHLSTKSSKQAIEGPQLVEYIKKYFNVTDPDDIEDYVVLGGDFNAGSRNANIMWVFKNSGIFIDQPIPVDQNLRSGTNSSRSKEHDFVITNEKLHQYISVLKIGNNVFPNGLVFDSRTYKPLSDVYPVEYNDSGASYMQHMPVIKVYLIPTK